MINNDNFAYIGDGQLGGKAHRLFVIKDKITSLNSEIKDSSIIINIPRSIVITTKYFDRFMEENNLYDTAFSDLSDEDKARRFLKGELPEDMKKTLATIVTRIRVPLAVRSSSHLDDCLNSPFAGIYMSKMIPNNQPDKDTRLHILEEAIKLVYASTFFKNAISCRKATSNSIEDEKMALIIQEVVGLQHNNRYYPNICGVARSYNFYPAGHSKPEHGVVNLALGMGKAIADGGVVWSYSPEYPEVNPPCNSINVLLEQEQLDFWAVNMDKLQAKNPVEETEYMVKLTLEDVERDGTLGYIASSYDFGSDHINIGIGYGGSRNGHFAPQSRVDLIPVNQLIKSILKLFEETFNTKIDIEFAVTFDLINHQPARLALLQVEPMTISEELVELDENQLNPEAVFACSENVMGNGCINSIKDVVYVSPETFDLKYSQEIAFEIENINSQLVETKDPYLLIGFGRWGTSNPGWGIPVKWGQICGSKVIIESSFTEANAQLSQGSHFFHNINNLRVLYFSIKKDDRFPVDWKWLKEQRIVSEGKYIKHVRLKSPLIGKVDGRKRMGVILK